MKSEFYVECDYCGSREYVSESDIYNKKKCFFCDNELESFNRFELIKPNSIQIHDSRKEKIAKKANSSYSDTVIRLKNLNDNSLNKESKGNKESIIAWIIFTIFIFFIWQYYNLEVNEDQKRKKVLQQERVEQRLREEKEREKAQKYQEEQKKLAPEALVKLIALGYSGDIDSSYRKFCNDYGYSYINDNRKRIEILESQLIKNRQLAIFNNYIKNIKTKVTHKNFKKQKESSKAEFWNKIHKECEEKKICNEFEFWKYFSSYIINSFEPPFSKVLPSGNWRCPFSIRTSDKESIYFIKLTDINSGKVHSIFFKGGYFETNVPPGKYTFKYGCGNYWYGPVFLFGPDGSYYKSSDVLNFYKTGNQLCGQTVELIKQRNGNFHTQDIDESEF